MQKVKRIGEFIKKNLKWILLFLCTIIFLDLVEDVFEKEISPKISQITDRYLGRGQKVNQCSREQTEALDLIVTDMKDLMATI